MCSIGKFWQVFLHPRVFIFILTGAAIIFLTFLTDNNALEIAISAVVFIGIGVNNLSTLETHMKDDKKLKSKIAHSLKVMAMAKSRISKLTNEMNDENCSKVKDELAELEQFIKPGIQLIKEDSSLD